MIAFIIILIVFGSLTALIPLASAKLKTDYEKEQDDLEQMKFLKEWNKANKDCTH